MLKKSRYSELLSYADWEPWRFSCSVDPADTMQPEMISRTQNGFQHGNLYIYILPCSPSLFLVPLDLVAELSDRHMACSELQNKLIYSAKSI